MKPQFEFPRDVFDRMVGELSDPDHEMFLALRAVRTETAYRGRSLIAYTLRKGKVRIHDRFTIDDFFCDTAEGGRATVKSTATGKVYDVGYKPVRLGSLKVFVWVPLHARIHWDVIPDHDQNASATSLGFNLCVKVQDRRLPGSEGVLHVETGREFARRFPGVSTSPVAC